MTICLMNHMRRSLKPVFHCAGVSWSPNEKTDSTAISDDFDCNRRAMDNKTVTNSTTKHRRRMKASNLFNAFRQMVKKAVTEEVWKDQYRKTKRTRWYMTLKTAALGTNHNRQRGNELLQSLCINWFPMGHLRRFLMISVWWRINQPFVNISSFSPVLRFKDVRRLTMTIRKRNILLESFRTY